MPQVRVGWLAVRSRRVTGTRGDSNSTDPRSRPPVGTFSQVGVGGDHACGVRTDGTVVCWGALYNEAMPAGTFSQISASWSYSCGVRTDGTLACWGDVQR